ncbi:TRAP transporter large permease subunit [Chloroflexota bacterium]
MDIIDNRGDTAGISRLNRLVHILDNVGTFSRWVNIIGTIGLFLVVSLIFVEVIMRYFFNSPITMTWEITGLMMLIVVYLGIAHTQSQKGHISIDIITGRLSLPGRLTMENITTLISIGTFIILIWRTSKYAIAALSKGIVFAPFLPVPTAPFAAIVSIGCVLLCLLLIRDLLKNMVGVLRLNVSSYMWLLMFGIPVIVLIAAIFFMQPELWKINLPLLGVIGVAFSLALFVAGMPISFALILSGMLFIGHISGTNVAFNTVGSELFRTTTNYTWAVIAFFVLMGFICLQAGFGEDMYHAANKWFGHLPGGLAVATVTACTGFAAIVGEPLSATTTMGATALPEMRKYGYDDRLSAGTIAAGSTLGPMIPPSLTFIIYGIITQQSIGKLLISGIVPGLLLAVSFVLVIYFWVKKNPNLGPSASKATWSDRLTSSRAGIPVLLLFLLVIGGIYAGIFSPCEGGAIGAIGSFTFGLLLRRFTWKKFINALLGASAVVSMVFLLLGGAIVFTRFVAWCNLPDVTRQVMMALPLHPSVILIIILTIFFLLGFVIDTNPLVLIGVPILHPIAVTLGYDPILVTVLIVIMIHVGMITPPVGFSLFALKTVSKDIPIGTIYSGVFPFVIATMVVACLIFIFPNIAIWLPNILSR